MDTVSTSIIRWAYKLELRSEMHATLCVCLLGCVIYFHDPASCIHVKRGLVLINQITRSVFTIVKLKKQIATRSKEVI